MTALIRLYKNKICSLVTRDNVGTTTLRIWMLFFIYRVTEALTEKINEYKISCEPRPFNCIAAVK